LTVCQLLFHQHVFHGHQGMSWLHSLWKTFENCHSMIFLQARCSAWHPTSGVTAASKHCQDM